MTIEQLEQKYMKSQNPELFEIRFEKDIIKISSPYFRIELTRQDDPIEDIIFYSTFFDSRFPVMNLNIHIVKKGFSHIVGFLDEYSSINNAIGWAIVHNISSPPLHKFLINMFKDFNYNSVDEDAKHLMNAYFNGAHLFFDILASKFPEELSSKINNSYKTMIAINNVLHTHPLCSANNKIFKILYSPMRFDYHGFSFLLHHDKKNNLYELSHFNNPCTFLYPHASPITENDFTQILDTIEIQNRLKNIIQPPIHFFRDYIDARIGTFSVGHLQREFEKLLLHFEDWVTLETMFKKITDHNIYPRLVKQDPPSSPTVFCKGLTYQSTNFLFVYKEGKNPAIHIFIVESEEISNEVIETYIELLNGSM